MTHDRCALRRLAADGPSSFYAMPSSKHGLSWAPSNREQSTYSSPPTLTPRSSMLCCSRDSGRLGLRALRYKSQNSRRQQWTIAAGRQACVEILTFMAGKTPTRQDGPGSSRKLRETIDKHQSEHSLLDHSLRGGGVWFVPSSRLPLSTGRSRTWSWRVALSSICRRAESSPVVSLLRSDLSVPYAVRPYVRLRPCQTPGPIGREQRNAHGTREDAIVSFANPIVKI